MDKIVNNGSVIDYNEIVNNKEEAAIVFSEGDKNLENLLRKCYSKDIATRACCKGHKEINQKPYINLEYTKENLPYITNLLLNLYDKGYLFHYSKSNKRNSSISIEESDDFDFSKESTLFQDMTEVIKNTDINKNYKKELPQDLEKFIDILERFEIDNSMKIKYNNGERNQAYFGKTKGNYEFGFQSTDAFFNILFEENNFALDQTFIPTYYISSISHENNYQQLNNLFKELKRAIPTENEKIMDIEHIAAVSKIKDNEKLKDISFQYDDSIDVRKSTSLKVELGDTLEQVVDNLILCRNNNINSIAYFNDIELDNTQILNKDEMIEYYDKRYSQIKQEHQENSNSSQKK